MNIFIVAPENDNHTAPITWALERAGYRVRCWSGAGWSDGRQASISLLDASQVWLGLDELGPGDAVWIRRPEPPELNPRVSDADRKFAQGEYRAFSDALLYLLEFLPARCVNKYSAARTIRNKSVQLLLARSCGLRVPATLMSNAPGAVRAFLRACTGPSICKAFSPHIWRNERDTSVAVTETFALVEAALPADEVLTYAPAIYQQMVAKEFDVRIVLMGGAVYSFGLYNPKGSIDWRQDVSQGIVQIESLATPDEVKAQVLAFAQRSGIVFGSFDFAVDRDGNWWFLEVNEQGQFLWLDDFNPELHVQEKFLAFLTAPEGAPQAVIEERQSLFASWRDYLESGAATPPAARTASAVPEFVSIE